MRAEIRFIIVGSLTVINILCASPARDPKRAINGQTVDLTPLIEWWQHHAGKRPFPGWVHATGQIVGTNTCGWTVEGSVDTPSAKSKDGNQLTSGSKFILKTPPVQELAEFTRLDARLKELKAERRPVESRDQE
ncbi:MAG: hypothetical protein MUF81_07350 [Verrucomicrobia bacterium]|nr:hypothetical protein [Verrucomicrobiota bacterium]